MKTSMKTTLRLLATTAACISIPALNVHAAGFYIQESSISALGSAFSGSTTNIDDATTVYFNPAGMTDLSGPTITSGAHAIIIDAEIKDTGSSVPTGSLGPSDSPYDPEFVPNFFAATPINISGKEFWFGFGVSAPFGLANEYDDNWFGRYDATKTELKTVNVTTVAAYKINDMISIGGGIDIQQADADLRAAAFAGTEGQSSLTGEDTSFGYNIGVKIKPTDSTIVGLHYRSHVKHDIKGTVAATGTGGADFSSPGTVDLDLPDILTLGISHDINEKWTIMGQATHFGWSSFDEIRAVGPTGSTISNTPQNYEDSWAFAIGTEYQHSDKWTFRAGYQFDETPTVDEFRTARTPDGDRNWFTAGATYNINDKISVDIAGAYIDVADETINVSRNSGLSTVSASTEAEISIISLGLNYKF